MLTALLDGVGESGGALHLRGADYPEFLRALMADAALSPAAGRDPRIAIWGTLEARLQSVDLMVLGGLDEGVWPSDTRTDPFLSRAMRGEVGLPPPERRLGQAAHDFVQGAMAPRVIISRAEKRGGTPTVESRWLQRLEAVAGQAAMTAARERGDDLCGARPRHRLGEIGDERPMKKPEPKPPLAARPQGLSVTEIETLVRDPYAIYAKHVLGLEELEPLGRAPDYALRGSLIHEALGDFIAGWTGRFDAAASDALHRHRTPGARRNRGLSRHPCHLVVPLRGHRPLDRCSGRRRVTGPLPSAMRKSPARSTSRWARRPSACAAGPTASTAAVTVRSTSSISRPAHRRPPARCWSASPRSWDWRRPWPRRVDSTNPSAAPISPRSPGSASARSAATSR